MLYIIYLLVQRNSNYCVMSSSISIYGIIAFLIIFLGYIIQSSLLILYYYYICKNNYNQWKIQHEKGSSVGTFFSLFSMKPGRGPFHRVVTTFNLVMASLFALLTTEMTIRGYTSIVFSNDYGVFNMLKDFIIAVVYQSVVEYYWHRIMHFRLFYKHLHKYHHHYKAPEVYDDLYIHPLEAFGYYCILYGPPYVMKSLHIYAFVAYMIVMGVCGVLDHSGVRIKLLGIYSTSDHDKHHSDFDVNYAFPFPLMDIIHGTYEKGS